MRATKARAIQPPPARFSAETRRACRFGKARAKAPGDRGLFFRPPP